MRLISLRVLVVGWIRNYHYYLIFSTGINKFPSDHRRGDGTYPDFPESEPNGLFAIDIAPTGFKCVMVVRLPLDFVETNCFAGWNVRFDIWQTLLLTLNKRENLRQLKDIDFQCC